MADALGAERHPAYQARCQDCAVASRRFTSYTTAEAAAARHTYSTGHTAYVVDHYGMRVAGSTVRPTTT